jgi:hypothetical protein
MCSDNIVGNGEPLTSFIGNAANNGNEKTPK